MVFCMKLSKMMATLPIFFLASLTVIDTVLESRSLTIIIATLGRAWLVLDLDHALIQDPQLATS